MELSPLHLIRDNLYLFFSILTFIPQYLVITVSEIMVSVTGVEWAYTEAPPSMKARDPLTISKRTSSADGLRSTISTMKRPVGQFIPYYSNC